MIVLKIEYQPTSLHIIANMSSTLLTEHLRTYQRQGPKDKDRGLTYKDTDED